MTETIQVPKQVEAEEETGLLKSKWASRFLWAAVIQGAIAAVVAVLITDPLSYYNIKLYFNPAMVIAAGGGGTWLFTGYILYVTVGVIGTAVTALFYFYIEGVQGKAFRGVSKFFAWGHLLLMNIGVGGSMLLMTYGGYLAGWAGAAVSSGGLGYSDYQIHVHYLSHFEQPIGILVMVAVLGLILGGAGFIITNRKKN